MQVLIAAKKRGRVALFDFEQINDMQFTIVFR